MKIDYIPTLHPNWKLINLLYKSKQTINFLATINNKETLNKLKSYNYYTVIAMRIKVKHKKGTYVIIIMYHTMNHKI